MSIIRKCGKCSLQVVNGGVCPVFNRQMEDEEPGCPIYSMSVNTCDICGTAIISGGTIQEDEGKNHIICDSCMNSNPCLTCINMSNCLFETDKSCGEPKVISVQKRQGNMIVQTQAINPKRVQKTCAKGCPCYYEPGAADGYYCWKQFNCPCNNYKIAWRN